jgi:hypothetical protein
MDREQIMKTDEIKIRTTPEFKDRVKKEADYRNLSITGLTTAALEKELSASRATNVPQKNHHCTTEPACQ